MRTLRLPNEFRAPVHTTRIVLRLMNDGDVDDIHAYQSREDVCRYLPFAPRTREQVEEKVEKYSACVLLERDSDFWQLAIERISAPGHVIGDIYFAIKDAGNATCEIGWTLHPAHTGHGYITEAASAVLDLAFRELHTHRTVARLDPANTASAAVCQRLGMRKEGVFVEDSCLKGRWGDTEVHAILDREWAARNA